MSRPRATRSDYAVFRSMTTRWRDNDVYGHMNNAVYYEYVDACVNGWLVETGALQVPDGPVVGLVVETGCVFHESLGFPAPLEAGLAVERLGRTSIIYRVGLFAVGAREAAAEARFIHVYVNSETHRPVPVPEKLRAAICDLG